MKNIFILLIAISILYPQVNIESMRKNNSNDGSWHKLGFDLGFVTGNKSEVMNLHGAYRFDFKKSNGYSGFLVSEYNKGYEKESGEDINIFSYKGFGHIRIMKNIIPHINVELFTQKEFNDFIDLDDRTIFGTGLRFMKKPNQHMIYYIGSGIMYEKESYKNSPVSENNKLKSTSYLNHTLFINDLFSMANIVYLQFDIDELNNYRILWDGILDFPFNQSFSLTMKVHCRYDVSSVNPNGDNYITISNGLNWNF